MLAMCNSYFWKLCIENRSISLNYRSISHDVSSMHVPDTLGLCHVYSTFYFPWLQQKMVVGDTLWFKFRPEDGYIVTVQGATDRELKTSMYASHGCNTDAYTERSMHPTHPMSKYASFIGIHSKKHTVILASCSRTTACQLTPSCASPTLSLTSPTLSFYFALRAKCLYAIRGVSAV